MNWRPVFEAPVLRGLDAASRDAIEAAGGIVDASGGDEIYREGAPGDSFFVVIAGEVELEGLRRGDDEKSVVRVARRGEAFGVEATLGGSVRRLTARALSDASVAEIPVAVYLRAVGRAGAEIAERERRLLERAATRDLLGTLAFTRDLPADDVDVVLDAAERRSVARGERIYGVGDPAEAVYLLVDGLVQLQTEDSDRIHVRAYLSRGDFFGDEEAIEGRPRGASALSLGEGQLLVLGRDVLRGLSDRNPRLLRRLRRIAAERGEHQAPIVGAAAARSTQHVFLDLYRMQMARSMLVIDQGACVRCGHCSWSCAAVYGTSRLVRRGDKIVATVDADARDLALPSTCQHCKNPVCMIDCPTGAIGRDPDGDVFIREDLCTGCGNCAKACPWDNIRMAPRATTEAAPASSERQSGLVGISPEVAVKCDLCRDYEAPACVQACPTDAITRLVPTEDFAEVGALLGASPSERKKSPATVRAGRPLVALAAAVAFALGGSGFLLQKSGAWTPASGAGFGAGVVGALAIALLGAYSIPKRRVRSWMKPREKSAARRAISAPAARPRSVVRPFYLVHLGLGLVAMAAVVAHAGTRLPASPAGVLQLAFWLTAVLGAWGALAYSAVPKRLARLERESTLPEDLGRAKDALLDRFHRDASGKSDLLKTISAKILLPYARAPFGPFLLALSGRTLRAEQARLRTQVDRMLDGRGGERLVGLDDLVRTVVDLRALPARRVANFALRAWLAAHIVTTGVLVVALVLHVYSVTRWP